MEKEKIILKEFKEVLVYIRMARELKKKIDINRVDDEYEGYYYEVIVS